MEIEFNIESNKLSFYEVKSCRLVGFLEKIYSLSTFLPRKELKYIDM